MEAPQSSPKAISRDNAEEHSSYRADWVWQNRYGIHHVGGGDGDGFVKTFARNICSHDVIVCTEIARRLAALAQSPFVKVSAPSIPNISITISITITNAITTGGGNQVH